MLIKYVNYARSLFSFGTFHGTFQYLHLEYVSNFLLVFTLFEQTEPPAIPVAILVPNTVIFYAFILIFFLPVSAEFLYTTINFCHIKL